MEDAKDPEDGKRYLGFDCPKCGKLIATDIEVPRSVKVEMDPAAKFKVVCRSAGCMRFGKEQTLPSSLAKILTAAAIN
jgi:hypothetical protein